MLNIHLLRNAQTTKAAAHSAAIQKAGRLSQAASGQQVTIAGLGELSPAHRQHLQAYGLLPGRSVRVLAQRPVTIVLVEQTELAFETEIAQKIIIE